MPAEENPDDPPPEPDQDEDTGWQQERAQLVRHLEREQTRTRRLRGELERARTRLRDLARAYQRLTASHAQLQDATGRFADDAHLFSDPAEQFDFELRLAWARRITAGQKAQRPLRPYRLGDGFLSSFAQAGADRGKVIDVVVEILTGLHIELDSRELHQLRTSDAGNAPPVTRLDRAHRHAASRSV